MSIFQLAVSINLNSLSSWVVGIEWVIGTRQTQHKLLLLCVRRLVVAGILNSSPPHQSETATPCVFIHSREWRAWKQMHTYKNRLVKGMKGSRPENPCVEREGLCETQIITQLQPECLFSRHSHKLTHQTQLAGELSCVTFSSEEAGTATLGWLSICLSNHVHLSSFHYCMFTSRYWRSALVALRCVLLIKINSYN